MNFKKLSSGLISLAIITSGSVGMNMAAATSFLTPSVQAQSAQQSVNTLRGCYLNAPFTATIAFSPTNIRAQPSTSGTSVGTFTKVGEVVKFSGLTTGTSVPDAWDGKPDNMWYRLADGRGWVAGAVVRGYPNRSNCDTNSQKKAETFFRWANGQRGITRLDRNDLNGQCVTLAVRYLQDVYFNGDRSPRAYGHGKDVASGVARQHPTLFRYKTSGIPKRGAIISFQGNGYNTTYGHVGIVLESRSDGSFTMLDSNSDSRGTASVVKVQSWRTQKGVVGWADPINDLP